MTALQDDTRALAGAVRAWLGPEATWQPLGRLGGLSNRTHHVAIGGTGARGETRPPRHVVVRLPGEAIDPAIDRRRELVAARAAHDAGVGPLVLHADPDRGVLVTEWLDGARPLDGNDLERPALRARTARALARLHGMRLSLGASFEPGALLASYVARARARGQELDARAGALLERATGIALELPAPLRTVLCHGDLTPGNVLLTRAGEVCFVDFEYAVDADPAWDLAELASSRGLDVGVSDALCAAYRSAGNATAPALDDREALRTHLAWRVLADAIAATWALGSGHGELMEERLAGCARMLEAFDAHASQR